MISKPKKKKLEPTPAPAPTPTPAPGPTPSPDPAPIQHPINLNPTPPNPPAPVPTGDGPETAENGLMDGEKLEETLKEMQSMGFEKDKCMAALRAAFYNPERAVDYLLNGIPQDPQTPPVAQPGPANPGLAGAGAGAEGTGDLAFLRDNPMFTAIRERIIREPEFFQTFMNQLAQTQPQLHQTISANPQAFLSLLLGNGGGGEGGSEGNDPPGTIRVTQEEKNAIERLVQLGFPKHRAIEAYFSCDKNEEWAANFLFENAAKDDNYDQEVVQEESMADVPNVGGDVPIPSEPHQNPSVANNDMDVDQPAENPPADNAPAQAPPVENPPVENPPVENPPVENAPADNPPAENAPEDNPPVENAPADNPPADNPPADNPPADNAPADNPPADNNENPASND